MKRYGYTSQKLDGIYTKALDVRFLIVFAGFIFWIFSFMASGENLLDVYLFFGFFYILLAMLAEIAPWVGFSILTIFTMITSLIFLEPDLMYSYRKTEEIIFNVKLASTFFIFYNFTITFASLFSLRNEIKANKVRK